MKHLKTLSAAAILSLATSAFAGPTTVDFNSTMSVHGLDSFSGTAVYDNTTDKLTIQLTNTSVAPLTSFAFDTEPGEAAKYEKVAGSKWRDDRNKKDIVKAKPFGKYDAGSAVQGHWGSLGRKAGIAAGATQTFVFDITGSDASTLSTMDFFSDTARPQIVATFTGIKHHKADRAGGTGHEVITNSVNPVNNDPINNAPILNVDPPVVINPPTKTSPPVPSGGGNNGPSAVPLPAAAPAGFAMLGVIGLGGLIKHFRGKLG